MAPLSMSRALATPSSASIAERYGSAGKQNIYIQNNYYGGAATSGSCFGTYGGRMPGRRVTMAPNMYDNINFHHHHHCCGGGRMPEWLMYGSLGMQLLGGIADLFKGNSGQGS